MWITLPISSSNNIDNIKGTWKSNSNSISNNNMNSNSNSNTNTPGEFDYYNAKQSSLLPLLIPDPFINKNKSYPIYRSLLDIVKTWNPDNPDIPLSFVEEIQHFNYSDLYERGIAETYN